MIQTSKKKPVSKIPSATTKAKSSGIPLPRSSSTTTKKSNVKPPPDFSAVHHEWSEKLARGKACAKRPCTVVNQFKFNHAEHGTSSDVARSSVRRTTTQGVRIGQSQPTSQRPKRGIPSAKKAPSVTFSVPETKKFQVRSMVEQQRLDGVSEKFESSAASLRSILNATGVDGAIAEMCGAPTHRQTIATATFKTPAGIPPNFRSPFSNHHKSTDHTESRMTFDPHSVSRQTLTPRGSVASRLAGPIAVEQRQSIYKKYIYPLTASQLAAQEAASDRQSIMVSLPQARRVRVQSPARTPVQRHLSQSTGKKSVKWRDANQGLLVQRSSDKKDNVAVTLFQDDVPAVSATQVHDDKPHLEKTIQKEADKSSPAGARYFPSPLSDLTNSSQITTPPATSVSDLSFENKENAASPVSVVRHASAVTGGHASPAMTTLMTQIAELDRKQEQLEALKSQLKRKLDTVQQQDGKSVVSVSDRQGLDGKRKERSSVAVEDSKTCSAIDKTNTTVAAGEQVERVAKVEPQTLEAAEPQTVILTEPVAMVSQPPVVRRHIVANDLGFQPIAPAKSYLQQPKLKIAESKIEGFGHSAPLACKKSAAVTGFQPVAQKPVLGLQGLSSSTASADSPSGFRRPMTRLESRQAAATPPPPPRIRQRLSYDIDQLAGLMSACTLQDPASADNSITEVDEWIDSPDISVAAGDQTSLFEPIQRMVEPLSFRPYDDGASPLARAISCLTPKRGCSGGATEPHSPVLASYSPTASLAGSAQLMLGRANENHHSFASSLAEIAVAAPVAPATLPAITPPRRHHIGSPHRPQGELSLAGSLLRKRHTDLHCGVSSPGRRILDDEVALFACRLRLTVGALPARCINPIAGILQQQDAMHFVPI